MVSARGVRDDRCQYGWPGAHAPGHPDYNGKDRAN